MLLFCNYNTYHKGVSMKKAVSIVEFALVACFAVAVAVTVMNSTGKSIIKLGKQTTQVQVRPSN